jgi:PAS domain S-box-containing protein
MTEEHSLKSIVSDSEALRETLLDLDRARARAEALRRQSEALLTGLRILSGSRSSDEVFSGLLGVLKEVIGFEDAFVLVGEEGGVLRTHATTSPRFEQLHWVSAALTRRTMERPIAVFDVRRVEEWAEQPEEICQGVTSALHIALHSEIGAALLICVHQTRSFFGSEHVQLAERFALLASQAIHDAELRSALVERNRFFVLSLEIMAIIDFDGFFRQINAAWESTLGFSRNQIFEARFIDQVLVETPNTTLEALQSVMQGEMAMIEFENWIRSPRGRRRVAWRCSAVASERLLYLVGRDVTEPHALQRQLIEARESAELASQSKSRFLATMSHELRTPLNGILGTCEALQEGVYGPLSESQTSVLSTVERSGRHQLNLVNDLLDLSKVEAGGFEPVLESFSLVELCHNVVQTLRPRAQKCGLQVNTSFDDEVVTILSDERRVRQMILNLLDNAIKFTPKGGRIGLDLKRADAETRITIWDTGIGIPEHELERLFQPFTQLDSALSRKHSGTGLGLNLTSTFADMLGGRIEVKTRVDKGSRFTLCLPYQDTKAVSLKPDESVEELSENPALVPSSQDRSSHVLLVDDNPSNLGYLKDFLEAKGHRVDLAYSGQEALSLAQQSPDLVFMDVQMPAMDGIEVIQLLRANPATQDLYIVCLTALAMDEDRERCLAAGANDYLSKPISLQVLLKKVENRESDRSELESRSP